MRVHRDITNLPSFKNAAITIGTFDGVHTGHLQIIQQLKKEAEKNNGESVIITFHPHPKMIVRQEVELAERKKIELLNTLDEKIELLQQQKIDHLVVVPFTLEFSNQSAENYISDFLVSQFHPSTIIVGYDHHFGKGRKGDYQLLEQFEKAYGYKVKEIPEHVLHHVTISSTKIRNALKDGDIVTANECLGYEYFFEGKVIEGNQLGRQLDFPTANLEINDANKLIPADGIYVVTVEIGKEFCSSFSPESFHKGMMSIGIRPTIGDNKRMIEVNIFDFEKNIYGRRMRVTVKKFLRKEENFITLEALKVQMAKDKINSINFFKSLK